VTLRDTLLPRIDALRAIPGELGFRPYTSVRIRTRTWSGTRPGDGTPADEWTDLTTGGQPAKVSQMNVRAIAASNGQFLDGDCVVGPLTPTFSGGGYDPSDIASSSTARNVERHVVLQGPGEPEAGSVWAIINPNTSRSLRYTMVIRRTERTA